jgi:hypothetical protein
MSNIREKPCTRSTRITRSTRSTWIIFLSSCKITRQKRSLVFPSSFISSRHLVISTSQCISSLISHLSSLISHQSLMSPISPISPSSRISRSASFCISRLASFRIFFFSHDHAESLRTLVHVACTLIARLCLLRCEHKNISSPSSSKLLSIPQQLYTVTATHTIHTINLLPK